MFAHCLQVVSTYGTAYPTLQPRITKTLVGALLDFSKPLTTHYGAIRGLCAMGEAARSALVFANLSVYVPFLQSAREDGTALRKKEAAHVWSLLLQQCLAHVKGVLAQQEAFVKQLAETADGKDGRGAGKRGREEVPAHPAVTATIPLVKQFRETFGAAAFDKAAREEKVDLSLF